MTVDFERLTWKDYPETETPLSAENLNRLEEGVAGLYSDLENANFDQITENIETLQEDVESLQPLLEDVAELKEADESKSETIQAILNELLSVSCFSGLRFKDLGTAPTASQLRAIAQNDFSDLWNGDYWDDGTHVWRIVDNTCIARRRGDTNFDTPSLIIMPDDCLLKAGTKYMNDSDTTANGYNGSKYRSTYRSQCKSIIANWCGSSHIADHKEVLSTAVSNGKASSWGWASCDVELPSEFNIYGAPVWANYTDGGAGYNVGSQWGQFRLFQLAPYMAINRSEHYWLRDVVSATWFAYVDYSGLASYYGASYTAIGLRPFFIMVGE